MDGTEGDGSPWRGKLRSRLRVWTGGKSVNPKSTSLPGTNAHIELELWHVSCNLKETQKYAVSPKECDFEVHTQIIGALEVMYVWP